MPPVSPMISLREEQQAMSTMLDLLQQEQQHLIAADIDGLNEVTSNKTALVSRMATLAQLRHRALGAAGYPAKESGMDAWLAASGDAQALTVWHKLLEQTRQAKELNRINGMLINRHMGYTQGALNALRPPAQANNSFYGPSGHATNTPNRRGFLAG